jgi:hypothetical protein
VTGSSGIWPKDSTGYWCERDAGASPLFPPADLDLSQAIDQVAEVVHRDPKLFDIDRSTWTLCCLRSVMRWMQPLTLAGVQKLLSRFELVYKGGRQHGPSPDPLYSQKLAAITRARELAQLGPGQVVFLYADEHTANVRPRVGRCYSQRGTTGAKATGSASRLVRLAGALDVATGQVLVRRGGSFNVKEM